MARDMSDKEILKMELEQLKKEVSTPRTPVSIKHVTVWLKNSIFFFNFSNLKPELYLNIVKNNKKRHLFNDFF